MLLTDDEGLTPARALEEEHVMAKSKTIIMDICDFGGSSRARLVIDVVDDGIQSKFVMKMCVSVLSCKKCIFYLCTIVDVSECSCCAQS